MSAEQLTETATVVPEQPQEKQELFAVTPLPTCPHVEQQHSVGNLPTKGLDVKTVCTKCPNTGENWVCLKCYEVNCSRFIEGHAVEHADMNEHPLALSYADFSVWCYPCNAYIDNWAFKQAKDSAMASKFGEEVATQ